ncbi:ankyrin-3 isoform X1 [Micractinium conductrix]|uniref:Ankyrin-3 isoform X1 n=1 Tax=Micractinium conductrix TaxID=554055 RepID=A0A2P6V3D4_9CHLO|nr:ankyrin-3 isoform X1 [Micractinium conductrix]|eukprot:PSC68600.1 ankyrin-3 isoform X1 [Micractinium conductrix]
MFSATPSPAAAGQACQASFCSGTSSGSGGVDVEVLELLLSAGADPLQLLPRLLQRYEASIQAVHSQPFYAASNPWCSALSAVLRAARRAGATAAHAPDGRRQLLLAAVCCRDEPLCHSLIGAARGERDGGAVTWGSHTSNCRLLVAAAEHDMPTVIDALLGVRLPGGGQPFRVAPPAGGVLPAGGGWAQAGGGMAHEGATPLMAAAERDSCAAVRALLAAGAAVGATDEEGVDALHWAVIGGAFEAAEMLLAAGASPSQACAPQPDGLHLERPLLTALKEGHCRLARLLLAAGASPVEPTPRGCTPLSVALAYEQAEAARLLLGLGADSRQAMPAGLHSGRYSDPSLLGTRQPGGAPPAAAPTYASLVGLAASRRSEAGPLLELLLGAGADPSAAAAGAHSAGGADGAPLAEAAAAGAVEGAAHLLHWGQHRGLTLAQLGCPAAAAAAARRALASELLCLLLDAWQAEGGAAGDAALPPPQAGAAVVGALLEAHAAQQMQRAAAGQPFDAACELQAVLLAERLSDLGLPAELTPCLAAAPHNRNLVLAAMPSTRRWSPATHVYFPPPFKAAARALLLAAERQRAARLPAAARACCLLPAGTAAGDAPGASLACLPAELLQHILSLSASPLSLWLH